MAYPPPPSMPDPTNSTPQVDDHPARHISHEVAIDTIVNELGNNPSGASATVEARITSMAPPGIVAPFAGSVIPAGWLLCDGSEVNRTTYADLFAAISTAYGGGNGTTTFNLPNLKGRFAAGRDPAVAAHDTLGEIGGGRDATVVDHVHAGPLHTHPINVYTGNENVAHTHEPQSGAGHQFAIAAGSIQVGTFLEGAGGTSFKIAGSPTGNNITAGQSVNHVHPINSNTDGAGNGNTGGATGAVSPTNANLPPYLTLNYIIRALL